jgi:two-component system NtrC family sensor kinase
MSFSLAQFGLKEMLRCGLDLRKGAGEAATLEELAQGVVRYFYDECRDAEGGRECVMARFYKTHAYGDLPAELQAFARGALEGAEPSPDLQCLALLATAGDAPAWNDRRASRGHQAIPLPSVQMVEQAPMIAELIRAMGMDVRAVVTPHPELVRGMEGKTFNVFFVPEALDSPYIPAQGFVRDHGVRSVLGFGGVLVTGEFYAIILFTRVAIPPESSARFRNVALDLKLAISSAGVTATFAEPAAPATPLEPVEPVEPVEPAGAAEG